jgi:hypothetical protein
MPSSNSAISNFPEEQQVCHSGFDKMPSPDRSRTIINSFVDTA